MHLGYFEVVCMLTWIKPKRLAFCRAQAVSVSYKLSKEKIIMVVLNEPFCVFVLTIVADNPTTRANAKTLAHYPSWHAVTWAFGKLIIPGHIRGGSDHPSEVHSIVTLCKLWFIGLHPSLHVCTALDPPVVELKYTFPLVGGHGRQQSVAVIEMNAVKKECS